MEILCRYGELALKGGNRKYFEEILRKNMREALKGIKYSLKSLRGRIFVSVDDSDSELAVSLLKRVFGLVSISPSTFCDFDIDKIKELSFKLLEREEFSTFRVTTKRNNKSFPITSMDLDKDVGAFLFEYYEEHKIDKGVSLKTPDIILGIEIFDRVYIFTKKIACPGGLPQGVSGDVVGYINSELDLYACWLMRKRGCNVILASSTPEVINLEEFPDFKSEVIQKISFDSLNSFVAESNCRAIIFCSNNIDFSLKEKFSCLLLYPCFQYSDEELVEFAKLLKK